MTKNAEEWENLGFLSGPDGVLFAGFRNPDLRKYIGMTLNEVATLTGKHYADVAMDFVIQDGSRVDVVYFLMSEKNVKRQIKLPYMSFGSDAGSIAPEGVFLKYNPHPRAYGNFARLLGKYVREEKVIEKDKEKTREAWVELMKKEDTKFLDEIAIIGFENKKRKKPKSEQD